MAGDAKRSKRGEVVYPQAFLREDEAFLRSLRQGDRAARAELYRRYARHVERVLVRVLGWNAEIPDLVQEVFLRVLSSLHNFRGDRRSLKPWITRIAVHAVRGWIRKKQTLKWLRIAAPSDLPDLPARVAGPEQQETLRRAYAVIDKLPATERIAFTLRFIEDMELSEVAEACDVSLATIKRRLQRARTRFSRLAGRDPYLKAYLGEGEEP